MKKIFSFFVIVFFATALFHAAAWGQTIFTSTGSGGSWNVGATWAGGSAPSSATDSIVIADGSTVTINTAVSVASITVGQGASGILKFDGVAARAVTVSGPVTVAANGTFITQTTGTFTNTMSIGGNLTNDGIFDMSQGGSTLLCTVTFNKVGDQTISGSGTTTRFRSIVLDKGTPANKVLCSTNVSDAGASPGAITFTNGTWQQTASTFTVSSGSQTIGANGSWVFSGSGSLNMAVSASIVVTGNLTVNTSGTFTMGTGANSLTTVGTPTLNFIAGTVTFNGRFTLTVGTTTISGATIIIDPQVGGTLLGPTSNTFECSGTANLTFSSGSITLVDPNAAATSGRDVKLTSAGTVNISGGTIFLGDGVSTSVSSTFHGFIISSAGITLNNLVLQGGNISGRDAVLQNNCEVAGTLTLTSNLFRDSINTLTLSNPIAGTATNLFAGSTSSITIAGSASGINIPSSVTALNNLTLNNSNGTTLQAGLAIGGILTLTNGSITTTNTNLLTLGSLATVSGGSSSSFVNGPMAHTIASTSLATKTFPIGKGTAYRPVVLAITQGAATTTTYKAEVFNAAPVTNTLDGTFGPTISTVRYWSIVGNPITGITSSTVQITYNTDDGVTDFANLQIAQGPSTGGGAWINLGGAGTANTTGTITSTNALTDFTTNTVYTLANTTIGTNPLPVELTSFTALARGSKVELNWKTATEVNNYGFEIERKSTNNQQSTSNNWAKVGFVEGHGTTNAPQNYSFTDNSISFGKYSYRLKQIDRDGKFDYSKAVESTIGITPNTMILGQNYPNPFNPETSIDFVIPASGVTSLKVYNILGAEVATLVNGNLEAGVVHQVHFDGKSLPSGLYFYALRSGNFVDTKKMLMVK